MWLKEGDMNSRFFHLSTLKHRTTNKICGIKSGGDTLEEDKEISKETINFFSSIISKEHSLSNVNQRAILKTLPQVINFN